MLQIHVQCAWTGHIAADIGGPSLWPKSSQELPPRRNMKAARSVNHMGLPGGGGLWVCMRRPQQLYCLAAWDECTCAGAALLTTFLSELRVLASLLLCVCALDSSFRSRKRVLATWGGSALQRRGPSHWGVSLLGFSGPAAPCALLTARYGKLRTRARKIYPLRMSRERHTAPSFSPLRGEFDYATC